MGRWMTGRIQHPEINEENGWPTLPSHRGVSSAPLLRREQPQIVVTTRSKSEPTQDTDIQLENRFAPLLQDSDSLKESSSTSTRERYETKSYSKRLQKERTTGPQTLIVGDGAVNEIKCFCSEKNTKVLFSKWHGIWYLKENYENCCWASDSEICHHTHRSPMLWSNNQRYWNKILLICWTKFDVWMLRCIWADLCQQYNKEMRDLAGWWCLTGGSRIRVPLNQWTLLTISTFLGM